MEPRGATEIQHELLEKYVSKDLLDKGIEILEGDFFSFGTIFFEVITSQGTNVIFGQIEHRMEIEAKCIKAREGVFNGWRNI